MEQTQTGTVKWYNTQKGFGFIMPDGTEDEDQKLFFHYTALNKEDWPEGHFPQEDQRVVFESEMGEKGPRATSVALLQEEELD